MLRTEMLQLQHREAEPAESNADLRELHQLLEALRDRFGAPADRRVVSPRGHLFKAERHGRVALR